MTSHSHTPIPHASWWVPFAFTLMMAGISYAVSGWLSYTRSDKALAVDVATLQTQRAADKDQINRIEAKLDKLLDRLTWAFGKPKTE